MREGWTSSDHNVIDLSIEFEASEDSEETWASGRLCFARADLKILDGQIKNPFEQEIKHMPVESGEDLERMANDLSKGMIDACEASMPKRTAHKKSNPWWNSRLIWFKRQAYRLRRKMQRAKPEPKRQAKLTCRAHWLKYRTEITKAKTKSWAKFVTEVGNAELWGFVCKHQTKLLRTEKDVIIELRKSLDSHNESYVLGLLFDITGAFDNVWWPLVFHGLKHRNCPKNIFNVLTDYFENRKVSIKFRRDMVSKTVSKGCPQGSVLGSVCWNIMFDEVLRILTHIVGEDNVVAYADDLLVLVSGNTRKELEDRAQEVVNTLETWCGSAKLQLSAGKTEMIMMKHGTSHCKKRKGRNNVRYWPSSLLNRPPKIAIGNTTLRMRTCVKYLKLILGRNMSMQPHCEYVNTKLTKMFNELARVAKSIK